jgi:hypothetical protein
MAKAKKVIQSEVDISKLVTVNTFASINNISISYVYKLIREGKVEKILIDNVAFIDRNTDYKQK